MKYLELREALKSFTLFSIREIKKVDNHFHRRRLNDWQEKGYIKKIIRGYYIFSDLELNENVLFEIANKIFNPSYVSLEMALSYYRLIPESVYVVTSVSSRKPYKYATPVGEFTYRKIKPGLFFGHDLLDYTDKRFKMATMEKAILDYFYLNPHISEFGSMRINAESFWEQINEDKLFTFLEKFSQKRLSSTINQFWKFMKNA
jgi:predicted transcriptional regulator of viral defense system